MNTNNYYEFLSVLADKYFKDIYLVRDNLNNINTPNPGSFDSAILRNNELDIKLHRDSYDFVAIYGDGNENQREYLYLFSIILIINCGKNMLMSYVIKNKRRRYKKEEFFDALGCSDFGLKFFEQFYFSRTRRSLEHYYPRANANGENGTLNEDQINCFGNYAMIGSEVNSSGSNWSPKTKLDHYLDASGKIKQVSVASIKFMIMMQICKDNNGTRIPGQEWNFDDIKTHQEKMLEILLGD